MSARGTSAGAEGSAAGGKGRRFLSAGVSRALACVNSCPDNVKATLQSSGRKTYVFTQKYCPELFFSILTEVLNKHINLVRSN